MDEHVADCREAAPRCYALCDDVTSFMATLPTLAEHLVTHGLD
jgi:hypothetical protein